MHFRFHTLVLIGLVVSRAEEAVRFSGGKVVLDELMLGGARGKDGGKGGHLSWQTGEWGNEGVWHEQGQFRSMCVRGQLYLVVLQLFGVDVTTIGGEGGGDVLNGGVLERFACVCEALRSKGIRLRVEPAQVSVCVRGWGVVRIYACVRCAGGRGIRVRVELAQVCVCGGGRGVWRGISMRLRVCVCV